MLFGDFENFKIPSFRELELKSAN